MVFDSIDSCEKVVGVVVCFTHREHGKRTPRSENNWRNRSRPERER